MQIDINIDNDELEPRDGSDSSQEKSRSSGGCSGGSGGSSSGNESSCNGKKGEQTPDPAPKKPRYKLKIDDNTMPENWWDKLPDFDPRVYDAIMMEQAEACVNYIFNGLPDMNELMNQMESFKFRKTCPRLKVQVPRTKVIRPSEINYDVTIDSGYKPELF